MAQHRGSPIQSKPSVHSKKDQPTASIKKPTPHIDLAQAIRREIERAIG